VKLPRPTVRARLTVLYAALFGGVVAGLLGLSYWLIGRQLDRTLPAELASDTLREIGLQYAIAFAGAVIVAVAIGWAMAGRVLAPLARITRTARRVSEERLEERIDASGPHDELRELAETLDSMLDRLEDSFEAQRRFVANASHELRSPLTVIRSEAEVALANPEPDVQELRELAVSVVEASRRTEALLTSLLILARSQRGLLHEEPVDLAAAAQAAHRLVEREAASEGVRVELRSEPATVSGDRALIERLVANLLENGVRYNRPGGLVSVITRPAEDGVRLTVENTGVRVDAAAAARLAQPFERLERSADGRGAGLGLSIVSAVCDAHGGRLEITPRERGGLCVAVWLPSAPARSDGRPARDSRDGSLRGAPA
jgi:signal transduction histidine kinase